MLEQHVEDDIDIHGDERGQRLQVEPVFVLGIPEPPPQKYGKDVPAFIIVINQSTNQMYNSDFPETATAAILNRLGLLKYPLVTCNERSLGKFWGSSPCSWVS